MSESEKFRLITKYENEISTLRLDLETSHIEIQKVKQLYVEVCSEKNGIEDRLKQNYDKQVEQLKKDYEMVLKLNDEFK